MSVPVGHTAAAHRSRRNCVSALELRRGAEMAQDYFDLARQYVGEARAYRAQRQRALARRWLNAATRMRLMGYFWKSGAAQSHPSVASLSVPLSFGQRRLTSRPDGIDHGVGRSEISIRTGVGGPIWNGLLAEERVFRDFGPIGSVKAFSGSIACRGRNSIFRVPQIVETPIRRELISLGLLES